MTLSEIRDGKVLAVVVLHNFRKCGSEVSFVTDSPKWASRRFIKEVFGFCFNHANYRRLTGLVTPDNVKSINLLERLGFKREGTLREAADDGSDLIIYGMLKTQCRWING